MCSCGCCAARGVRRRGEGNRGRTAAAQAALPDGRATNTLGARRRTHRAGTPTRRPPAPTWCPPLRPPAPPRATCSASGAQCTHSQPRTSATTGVSALVRAHTGSARACAAQRSAGHPRRGASHANTAQQVPRRAYGSATTCCWWRGRGTWLARRPRGPWQRSHAPLPRQRERRRQANHARAGDKRQGRFCVALSAHPCRRCVVRVRGAASRMPAAAAHFACACAAHAIGPATACPTLDATLYGAVYYWR